MAKKYKIKDGPVENRSFGSLLGNGIVTLIVIALALVAVLPMWHVLMSSLSDGRELLTYDGFAILPIGGFNTNAYELMMQNKLIIQGYINTIIYVAGAVGLGLVLNVLGGYVLYRQTKLNAVITMMITLTMLFSGGAVPTFMVMHALGLTGTRIPIILGLCTNSMFMIIACNAFRGVPKDTVEAATMDGCGEIRLMFQVLLPQCMSLMSVTILNTFIGAWNSWVDASIYVPMDQSRWPIQLVINQVVTQNENILSSPNPNYDRYLIQFAAIIIAVLPILVAFPFFQDKIEQGVLVGGVKG